MTGKVKWFDDKKGFGFIEVEDGRAIFVHYSALTGVKELIEGQKVDFDVTLGPKGLRATKVRVKS